MTELRDSTGERHNQGPRRDVLHFLDGMRLSIEMVGFLGSDIRSWIEVIERDGVDKRVPREPIIRLISIAWALVDAVHRLRELIQQAPGLRKRTSEVQLFLRASQNVEFLSNYVQHLRTEITNLPAQSTPVWGVISWVSEADAAICLTPIAGSPHPGISVYTIAVDTHEGRFAQKLILSVNNVMIDIPSLVAHVERISPVVEAWASANGYPPPPERFSMFRFDISGMVPRQSP